MSMKRFEDTCKLLKDYGYIPTGMDGPTKRIFVDDKANISITIEFDKDKLTLEEEEIIKNRLRELGYLGD